MPRCKVGTENGTPIEIHYEDHGSGQPVILIHEYPLNGNSWERQERALLAAGYRAISYDRRGFGRSSQPTVGYDYDTFAADLNTLLEHLDLRDVILVGFSMGRGEVTRYLGRFGSTRVRAAALLGAIPPFHVDTLAPDRVSEQAWEASFNVAAAGSPFATYAAVDSWLTDFRDDLSRIDVPVLVVHGTEDRILPIAATANRLPGLIADLRLVRIEGGPHNIGWTHGDEVNDALLEFLGGSQRTTPAEESSGASRLVRHG
jgi:non-heme chloroperoxidase